MPSGWQDGSSAAACGAALRSLLLGLKALALWPSLGWNLCAQMRMVAAADPYMACAESKIFPFARSPMNGVARGSLQHVCVGLCVCTHTNVGTERNVGHLFCFS